MISFQNVSFTYAESGNGGVLDLNLVVRSGECVLLCGPSGCGKTTVTRLANGLIPHFFHGNLSGQVNVNGMDTRETEIAALSDAVGTVFQNPRTQFFNTDTDSEIVFGLENRGIPREALRSRLDELTEELHLSELRGRNIFELSGGEKQKIAFSSVYASAPDVLVFDEPSSNLDMKAIGELADLIQRAKISGKTILIAEHRIWYLMDIVDRVVYMQDGRIASDIEAAAFKALPEADIRRMGLRVRDLSVSESGGVKTIAADGLLSVQKISVRLGGRNVLNDISFQASRGEIIAIAGVNGAGKSTQVELVRRMFAQEGVESHFLHFPRFDAPVYGELIARFLRGELGAVDKVDPYLVALLFAGDRADAAAQLRCWLDAGHAVVLDRYVYSNVGFQCAKLPAGDRQEELRRWILDLEFGYYGIPRPDVSLFLDVPFAFTEKKLSEVREGDDREYLKGERDIHEASLDLQRRVREVYRAAAAADDRLRIIDCSDAQGGMDSPNAIFARIRTEIERFR